MREQRKLQVGDTIECRNITDMLITRCALAREGVETEILDTKQCVLIVTGVEA